MFNHVIERGQRLSCSGIVTELAKLLGHAPPKLVFHIPSAESGAHTIRCVSFLALLPFRGLQGCNPIHQVSRPIVNSCHRRCALRAAIFKTLGVCRPMSFFFTPQREPLPRSLHSGGVEMMLPDQRNLDLIPRVYGTSRSLRSQEFCRSESGAPITFRQIGNHRRHSSLCLKPATNSQMACFQFAKDQKLSAASFKAVGALCSVRLGWFSWETKRYQPSVTLDEQVELLSLIGDVALKDGEPVVHAHAVIGKRTAPRMAVICWRRVSDQPVKSF
jgi:Plants and Prokaryotes Conserved (PCC) domain